VTSRRDAPPRPETAALALLAVEDSADDLELLARELVRNGMDPHVGQVETREQMEAALRERRWDVVCMDYQLPRFDALRALELRGELASDTPVIIVSGYIGETAAVALLKAGADDYIPKDNLARLAPAIRRAMRDGEERRARRHAEDDRARLVVQLQAALQLRDDFLVLASHELRTPLTALRFHLESAVRNSGEGEELVRGRLVRADQQIGRLDRLIEDMLTVSKLRPPEPLHPELMDVCELVSRVATSFSLLERIENLVVRVPSMPLVVRFDPVQIEDALRRILENAVKYGLGLPIDVSCERCGSEARISVTDRGVGIAPDKQVEIFERFGRAAPTMNYGGLGLGLWIARQIVQAHGGTLGVASRVGEGATFTVSLPV
jgi:signal transduction histidine kinase